MKYLKIILISIDSDEKNVGEEFLKIGAVKKVNFKIAYPKDSILKEDKEYDKIALVTKAGEQICAVGYHKK